MFQVSQIYYLVEDYWSVAMVTLECILSHLNNGYKDIVHVSACLHTHTHTHYHTNMYIVMSVHDNMH